MIEGYKGLNDSINQTINLISDIEMSSKEQLSGIEQINDAVNQLDQQTQQNAAIATQTNDIALNADEIAKLIVADANAKEFIGKNEVKSKTMATRKGQSKVSSPKNVEKSSSKSPIRDIKDNSKNRDDEWESF